MGLVTVEVYWILLEPGDLGADMTLGQAWGCRGQPGVGQLRRMVCSSLLGVWCCEVWLGAEVNLERGSVGAGLALGWA